MSRYVPPALRRKQVPATQETAGERNPHEGYSILEICHQFDYHKTPGTLNGDNQLSFILLFSGQHPQWPQNIFCKSNLQLLPSTLKKPEDAHPPKQIPLFIQHRSNQNRIHGKHAPFIFDGMYTIGYVDYLEPHTEELVKMLDLKFPGGKKRSPESWRESLSLKWAVIDIHKEESDVNPMIPLKPIQRKGVTEMLEEMRLKEVRGTGGEKSGEASEGKQVAVAEPNDTERQTHLKLEKQMG